MEETDQDGVTDDEQEMVMEMVKWCSISAEDIFIRNLMSLFHPNVHLDACQVKCLSLEHHIFHTTYVGFENWMKISAQTHYKPMDAKVVLSFDCSFINLSFCLTYSGSLCKVNQNEFESLCLKTETDNILWKNAMLQEVIRKDTITEGKLSKVSDQC